MSGHIHNLRAHDLYHWTTRATLFVPTSVTRGISYSKDLSNFHALLEVSLCLLQCSWPLASDPKVGRNIAENHIIARQLSYTAIGNIDVGGHYGHRNRTARLEYQQLYNAVRRPLRRKVSKTERARLIEERTRQLTGEAW